MATRLAASLLTAALAACATPMDCTEPTSRAMFDECVRITDAEDREKTRVLEGRPKDPGAVAAKAAAIAAHFGDDIDEAYADELVRMAMGSLPVPDPHDEPIIEGGY